MECLLWMMILMPGAYGLTVTSGLQSVAGWTGEQLNAIAMKQKMTSVVTQWDNSDGAGDGLSRWKKKGSMYPGEKLQDWLRAADIVHVSNEVPMFAGCPPAVPLREEQRFCSAPGLYCACLITSGVDVVELTGNHVLDWGVDAFVETLDLYDEQGLPYYGGGLTRRSMAQQPYFVDAQWQSAGLCWL